ncbi:MAG: lysylphosphatidylglycerol synthase domain-containing protein, partial [Pseudobdellovibrionaceae bacterium]
IVFLFIVGQKSGLLDLPLAVYFFLAPLFYMATAIPISPAGVGVGQAAFMFLFNVYSGVQTEIGSVVITVMQLINFITGLLGAYFYMTSKVKIPENLDEPEIALTK